MASIVFVDSAGRCWSEVRIEIVTGEVVAVNCTRLKDHQGDHMNEFSFSPALMSWPAESTDSEGS